MRRNFFALCRATALVVALVLSLVVVISSAQTAQAETPTTFAAAQLLNDSAIDAQPTQNGVFYPGGLYAATSAQQTSLRAFEAQAVADVIHDHKLSPADTNAVLSWARTDAQGDLWARVIAAVNAVHAGTATSDQTNVSTWLGTVMQRQGILTAQGAGLEYTKWAGIGTAAFKQLLANNASQTDLTNFLRTTPNPYTGTGSAGNPGGSTDGGFCTYIAPAPLQDQYKGNVFAGSDPPQTCFTPCTNPFGCAPPTPSFAQFAAFGAADFQNTLLSTTGTARAVDSTAVGASLAGVATVGSAGAGLGASFSLTSVMSNSAFQQSVFPFAGQPDAEVLGEAEAIWEEDGFDGVEALEEVLSAADEIGAEVASTGVGAIVAAIIFAVTTAIEVGLNVILTDEVPNQIAQLITQSKTATPNVFQALTQQPAGTFALFAGATLPLPSPRPCDNTLLINPADRPATPCLNPTPVPAQHPWDTQWVVTPRNGGPATTQSQLTLSDATSGLTSTSFLHGNWVVTSATVGSVSASVQSLRMHYTGWDGKGHVAWIFANQSPAQFVTVSDADLGPNFNPITCQTNGTCGLSTDLQVTGPNGTQESVSLTEGTEAPPIPAPFCQPGDPLCFIDPSTTTITGPTTAHVGHPVTFTAHVQGSPGETGTVEFNNGVNEQCPDVPLRDEVSSPGQIITGRAADCTVTFTKPGRYFIFGTYSGDRSFDPSQGELTIDVTDPVPTTTVLSANGGVVVGQPDTFTARVFVTPSGTTAAGTVTFTREDTGATLCDKVSVAPSNLPGSPFVATCTASFDAVGDFDVHAAYSGDPLTGESAGDVIESVQRAGTTVIVTASPAAPVVGQQVTYTATVATAAPGVATPTGHVNFDGDVHCTNVALSTTAPFIATCTATYGAPGKVNVNAIYLGDTNTVDSGGDTTVTIGHAATTITVVPSTAAPVIGEQVTYTATVAVSAPGVAVPTGLVTFEEGADCSGLPLPSSAPYSVTCNATYASAGDVTVTAHYSPDEVTGPSDATIHVTVAKMPTTTTLSASTTTPTVGQTVTYTATVGVSGSAVPGGTVAFSGVDTCAAVPLSASAPYKATCTRSYDTSGSVSVTATYSGDATTAGSSDTKPITVGKQASALSLTPTPATSAFGQDVALSATVSATATGPTPTGSVSFTVDGKAYGGVRSLAGGHASTSVTNLAPGTHTVAATYGGDGAYLGSSGSTTETVTCTRLTGTAAHQVVGGGCVIHAAISGPINVAPGGSLALVGAVVTGPITMTGAKSVLVCGSVLLGKITITNPTGQVTFGGPACASNAFFGAVSVTGGSAPVTVTGNVFTGPSTFTGNQAGVVVTNNLMYSPLTVTGNQGPVVVSSNAVAGKLIVSSNISPPVLLVSANVISGALACVGNIPPPTTAGKPNHVYGGAASGQCSGLT